MSEVTAIHQSPLGYKHYWPSDITSCVHWPGLMMPGIEADHTVTWRSCSAQTENHLAAAECWVFVFRLDSDRKSPHYFWKIRQGGWDPSTIYKQFFIQILLKHRFWISDYQFYYEEINQKCSKGVQTKVKLFTSFVTKLFYLLLECLFCTEKWLINQNFKISQDKRISEPQSSLGR